MADIIPIRKRHDYPIIEKIVDGEVIECVCFDDMTEDQFKQYCRDTGTEWFPRMSITIKT